MDAAIWELACFFALSRITDAGADQIYCPRLKGTALRNLNTLNEAPVYLPHSEQAYAPACRKVHV